MSLLNASSRTAPAGAWNDGPVVPQISGLIRRALMILWEIDDASTPAPQVLLER